MYSCFDDNCELYDFLILKHGCKRATIKADNSLIMSS